MDTFILLFKPCRAWLGRCLGLLVGVSKLVSPHSSFQTQICLLWAIGYNFFVASWIFMHFKNILKFKCLFFVLSFYFLKFYDVEAQDIYGATLPYNGSITNVSLSVSGSTNSDTINSAWYGDNLCRTGLLRGTYYGINQAGGSLSLNFTPARSTVSFVLSSADPTDIITLTTDISNPTITLAGTCKNSFSTAVSGSQATLTYLANAPLNQFVIVTISSTTPFSSLSIYHSGINTSGLMLFFDQTQFGVTCNVAGVVTATSATCVTSGGVNANAALTLTAHSGGATKVGYSAGSSYAGPDFATATAVTTAPMVLSSTLTNPSVPQPYTIRLFQDATCYKDVVVTLTPTLCLTSDLSVSLSPMTQTGAKGELLTYTITLTNAGPDTASDVQVDIKVPTNATLLTASPQLGTYSDATRKWEIGSLPVGAKTLTVTLKMN